MANNAIADSIITNMICRSLVPPVEPKVRSTEVALTSKNTLRILNTIKPVTKVFTAMDVAKLVVSNVFHVFPQAPDEGASAGLPSIASQVASSDRLKLAYQMRIDRLT